MMHTFRKTNAFVKVKMPIKRKHLFKLIKKMLISITAINWPAHQYEGYQNKFYTHTHTPDFCIYVFFIFILFIFLLIYLYLHFGNEMHKRGLVSQLLMYAIFSNKIVNFLKS